MSETFAVVIPYYQTDPKLLTEAIISVQDQSLPPNIEVVIVVVDDGSPSPAEISLNFVSPRLSFEIVLLKQENAGVGAARNKALDHLASIKPKYAAFLDSDDIWLEGHIMDAVKHIDNGIDFWFAKSFKAHSRNNTVQDPLVNKVKNEALEPQLTFESGETAFSMILRECLPHTSTSAYNFKKNPEVRFSRDLMLAGEDHLFWLTIASKSERVGWTTRKSGRRGEGVSIYEANLNWDSPKVIELHTYQTLLRQLIAKTFNLSESDAAFNQAEYDKKLQELVFLFLRKFLKMPRGVVRDLRRAGKLIDGFYGALPKITFNVLKSRFRQT